MLPTYWTTQMTEGVISRCTPRLNMATAGALKVWARLSPPPAKIRDVGAITLPVFQFFPGWLK